MTETCAKCGGVKISSVKRGVPDGRPCTCAPGEGSFVLKG